MPTIMLVGEDKRLLESRAAVLRTTGADVVMADSASAMIALEAHPCDLLVLCHSIPERASARFIADFRSRWPATPILRMASLRMWDLPGDDGAVHSIPSAEPHCLVRRAAELLGMPAPARIPVLFPESPGSSVLPQNS